jgi:P-type Mg2+ transporter
MGRQMGLERPAVLTGDELRELSETALLRRVAEADIFAEIEPNQKERILAALRKAGNVVGYLGDGINDTPALRAADIGLAVPEAVGVARQAADAILLDKDLRILHAGVTAARHAALNATKYLKATLSANLGNVLSVLAASAFLPFLPMLPLQLLVQNLGYDAAQLALPLDRADPEQLTRPHRWSGHDLTAFIACFAPISSAFDLVTFWLLQHLDPTNAADHQVLFHTGWFIESLLTQILAVLVIRTGRIPLPHSRPAAAVVLAALTACAAALLLPYTMAGIWLGLHPLPLLLLGVLAFTIVAYLAALQATKLVYRRVTGRWL